MDKKPQQPQKPNPTNPKQQPQKPGQPATKNPSQKKEWQSIEIFEYQTPNRFIIIKVELLSSAIYL